MTNFPIAVVGGGIAGLAAALRLAEHEQGNDIVLIERDTELGGKIRTEHTEGFLIEKGPDSFLAAKPAALGLCRDLNLAERLVGTLPARCRSQVLRNGHLYQLPEGISGLIPTRMAPLLWFSLLSPWGRVRASLELLLPRRKEAGEESIAAFITRRFGKEAYDWLVEPLLSGIYAGDGASLSLDANFPQLRDFERRYGSVLRGMRRRPRSGSGGFAFLAPETGLSEIVTALEDRLLTTPIVRGTSVVSLRMVGDGYELALDDGTVLPVRAAILATPAFETASLVESLDPELAGALAALPFVSTATVSVAFHATAVGGPIDSYGYIRPRAEGGPVVACTSVSTKWAGRAPEGYELFRVFVGRAGLDQVVAQPDADLLGLVLTELRETLGITAEPCLVRIQRWPRGMPQYTVGHAARMADIERRLARFPGILLAGHSYHGIGIPDCILSGQAAADVLLADARVGA